MAIHRLRGDVLETWALYPTFERRVVDFAKRSALGIDEARGALELRNRFCNMPLAAGYWLFSNEKQEIVGHICGWLTLNMGILGVFFLQAEGTFTLDHRRAWADDLGAWLDEIDSMRGRLPYIPAGPPVSTCEFVTVRDQEAWFEYLQRLGFEKPTAMTLVKFRRKAPAIEQVSAKGGNGLIVPKGLLN